VNDSGDLVACAAVLRTADAVGDAARAVRAAINMVIVAIDTRLLVALRSCTFLS
jgi:hypothetical protein